MYFFQELLNQKRSVQNAFDDKSLLKLILQLVLNGVL